MDDGEYGTRSVYVRLPTLVYTDPATETEQTFDSSASTQLPVDAQLPVAVRPGEPDTAFVPVFKELWSAPLILAIIGGGFGIAAIGLAFVAPAVAY